MTSSLSRLEETGSRGLAAGRAERAHSRALSATSRSRDLAISRLEAQAQVEAARMHAIGFVGQQALQAAAFVSQMEGQLAQAVPLATTRLQGIADMTALAIAQEVASAARRMSC